MDPVEVSRRPSHVRLLAVLLLAQLVSGCRDDHGPDVPNAATSALDCAGTPYEKGRGNYDTGPESVQDGPQAAVDDWQAEEGRHLPQVPYVETARHGDQALFTWSTQGFVAGAFVVRDDTAGTDGDRGWGVASYGLCDPAEWPPETSDAVGIQVWTNADGDRVPTSLVYSSPGAEHCGWEDMTFLWLGKDGRDGEFYGTPDGYLAEFLRTSYAAHAELPADASDTGYARDGRHLWLAADGSAAYLVGADGDAERWPAPANEPIRCA